MKFTIGLILMLASIESFGQVVSQDTLTSWGYELNPHKPYMEIFCAGSVASKSGFYQSIRATNTKSDNPRYRFTLGQEVYDSTSEAELMVDEILQPKHRTSKHSKLCNIRKAFNDGATVYFVHTDVGSFRSETESILEKLQQEIVKQ